MLKKIILKDFKGVRDGEYTFTEFVNSVCGPNGSGKTTLADAWYWFWTDRDYDLQSDPEIHPDFMAESEPSVTIIWDTGKQEVMLYKVQKDVRTKKQKEENVPVRISNKYEINSVPKTAKDFAADLKNMGIDIDNILLLTHPDYLLNQKIADRRAVIFPTAGAITTLEVAETLPDCAEAVALLQQGYKDDEIIAMKKAQKKRASDQLEALPNQIIGMERSKAVVDPGLEERKAQLEKNITEKTAQREECLSKSSTESYDVQIREVDAKKQAAYNQANAERLVGLSNARLTLDNASQALREAQNELSNINMTGRTVNGTYQMASERKRQLQAELDTAKAESFACDTVCPTCGQEVPKERIESAKEKWQTEHDRKLKDITDRIRAVDTQLAGYKEEGKSLAERKKDAEKLVSERQAEMAKAQGEVNKFSSPIKPDLSAYDDKIAEIRKEREGAEAYKNKANELYASISADKTLLANTIRAMGLAENNARIQEQIDAMKAQQTEYVQAKADAEKVLYQMQLIGQRKNELLSDAVNSHFTRVKWRLFVTQKNGEIKDDCTPMVLCSDGKFRDMTYGANTAAIQAAKLDICRGLQKFYGQNLPIWLDGAECFDEKNREALRSMDAQLILLCVTEDERLVIK